MREKPAYYIVFALRDKTVLAALESTKPLRRRGGRRPKIDPEGIHKWHLEEATDFQNMSRERATTRQVTIATCLNVKRILRERVESRLARIEELVADQDRRLRRIEELLLTFDRNGRQVDG